MSERDKKTAQIREMNDRLRKNLPDGTDVPGRLMITSGIQTLINMDEEPGRQLSALMEKLGDYDSFNFDNDPYAEHDFGVFDFAEARVFWKIDYYAPDMIHGADDPSDVENTVRVLTILLAEEY